MPTTESLGRRFEERARRDRAATAIRETVRLLHRDGYEGLRIEDVADRVGVAKGTVYLDFGSKQDLAASALERTARDLVADLSAHVAGIKDPLRRLGVALEHAARALNDREELELLVECRPLYGPLKGSPRPCAFLREFFRELIEQAIQAGRLGTDIDSDVASHTLVNLLAGDSWRRVAASEGAAEALRRSGLIALADVNKPPSSS